MTDDDTSPRALRSLLFVPGSVARRMAKADETAADAVIFDLEDAVAPDAKVEARALVLEHLANPRRPRAVVRINARDTHWYLDDLAAACRGGADAIMVPKCSGPGDLALVVAQLDALEAAFGLAPGKTGIIPLVTENAASLANLNYIGSSHRLWALGFAGEDLAADLGIRARDAQGMNPLLQQARRAVAVAAAAAGVGAIDTPFTDPADDDGLGHETADAVRLGFVGKLCIHPAQIATVNAAFEPVPTDLVWATAIVAAFRAAPGSGVILHGGKMVDRAHLRLAKRYIRQSSAASVTS